MRKALLAVGVLATAALSGHAYATVCTPPTPNLVANPSFEQDWDGTTNAQQYSPPSCWAASGNAGADNSSPNYPPDNMDGYIGIGSLQQSIATVAGATYEISFNVAESSDLWDAYNPLDTLEISFGGDSLETIYATADAYTIAGEDVYLFQGPYTADATSSSTLLSFTGNANDGEWLIDDISVTCDSAACAVPEPNSLPIFVLALLGFGAYEIARRRNRTMG